MGCSPGKLLTLNSMDVQLNHEGGQFLHYHHYFNIRRSLPIIKPQKTQLGQQKIN